MVAIGFILILASIILAIIFLVALIKKRRPLKWLIISISSFVIGMAFLAVTPQSKKIPQKDLAAKPEAKKAVVAVAKKRPEATWQKVKSWQGTGIKNTEPFIITGSQWRIIWSIKDTTGFDASLLQIFIYKVGGELPLDLAANAMGTKNDTSYIYKSGKFYLKINSANGNWRITVEELR